jgi:hypothetical protein
MKQDSPVVIITMSGTVDTFSVGSERRRSFITGLATLLQIPEKQIIILSVNSGSIIVELKFEQDFTSSVTPLDLATRLKNAASAGLLEVFGVTNLNINGQNVNLNLQNTSTTKPSLTTMSPLTTMPPLTTMSPLTTMPSLTTMSSTTTKPPITTTKPPITTTLPTTTMSSTTTKPPITTTSTTTKPPTTTSTTTNPPTTTKKPTWAQCPQQ